MRQCTNWHNGVAERILPSACCLKNSWSSSSVHILLRRLIHCAATHNSELASPALAKLNLGTVFTVKGTKLSTEDLPIII